MCEACIPENVRSSISRPINNYPYSTGQQRPSITMNNSGAFPVSAHGAYRSPISRYINYHRISAPAITSTPAFVFPAVPAYASSSHRILHDRHDGLIAHPESSPLSYDSLDRLDEVLQHGNAYQGNASVIRRAIVGIEVEQRIPTDATWLRSCPRHNEDQESLLGGRRTMRHERHPIKLLEPRLPGEALYTAQDLQIQKPTIRNTYTRIVSTRGGDARKTGNTQQQRTLMGRVQKNTYRPTTQVMKSGRQKDVEAERMYAVSSPLRVGKQDLQPQRSFGMGFGKEVSRLMQPTVHSSSEGCQGIIFEPATAKERIREEVNFDNAREGRGWWVD
ncbi:hypothetical protein VTL71DRAFT_9438 [Oculimacula yallundae]|uniref:Uncharacterized protein n=1 Tax=Oculimacula yallundae TaxID=86028 RepID=A0ABR4BS05_9HELO